MTVCVRVMLGNVLKLWLENFNDFTPEMHKTLTTFLNVEFGQGTKAVTFAATLLQKMESLAGQDKQGKELIFSSEAPAPIMPARISGFTYWDLDPMEIARQLTIIESATYQKIKVCVL